MVCTQLTVPIKAIVAQISLFYRVGQRLEC